MTAQRMRESPRPSEQTGFAGRVVTISRVLLAGFMAAQCILAISGRADLEIPAPSLAAIRDPELLRAWLRSLLAFGVGEVLRGFMIGLLTGLSSPARKVALPHRGCHVMVALTLAMAFSLILVSLETRQVGPHWLYLFVVPASLVGVYIGRDLLRGTAGLFRIVFKSVAIAGLFILSSVVAVSACTENQPSPRSSELPSELQKQQLMQMLQKQLQAAGAGNGTFEMRIDHASTDAFLAWLIDKRQPPFVRSLSVEQKVLVASLSIPLSGSRYLNLTMTIDPEIRNQQLAPRLTSLSLGRFQLPAAPLDSMGTTVIRELSTAPDVKEFLAAVNQMEFTDSELVITGQRNQMQRALTPVLNRFSEPTLKPDRITLYVARLRERAERYPEGDPRFLGLMSEAFQLAAERGVGDEATSENRAAILALAYLIGDSRLGLLLGLPPTIDRSELKVFRKVTLRGRRDWAQHFWISAALQCLGGSGLSHAVGFWKEKFDTRAEGSGFSFADLMADMAGQRFALAATSSPATAMAMHQRVAVAPGIVDVFPPANGLPEGLSDREFQRLYGNGSGKRYAALLAEIHIRLSRCSMLK